MTASATTLMHPPGLFRFGGQVRRQRRAVLDKTTLVLFMREDHSGALLEILTEFAVRGVNLTRIESRPA